MDAIPEHSVLLSRTTSALDRIEALYLKVLRAALLIVATVLLICAAGWAAYSLMRVMRSPDSVVEKPSVVSVAEIVASEASTKTDAPRAGANVDVLRRERAYYDAFVKKYFALYREKFQPSLRGDDKKLTIGEFDDLTINSSARLDAVRSGDLSFEQDRKDLDGYLPIVTQAANSKQTVERLSRYRTATKRPVATQVQRTRVETRRGWDTFSDNCENWYLSPIGCAVTRRVEVPYTETVQVMRYPDGIASPSEVLKGYQDRYFQLLAERRERNASEAASQRDEIVRGQAAGWNGLSQSILIAGGFLVLMFFFLLVAIERHQRRSRAPVA